MRIALSSDETYPVHAFLKEELQRRGHELRCFAAVATSEDTPWVEAARLACHAVIEGSCDEAILLCWTGTGVSMAANKITNIRAALCTDAQTAAGARIWNHANVLVLSNRLLSQDLAKEILTAWFETSYDERGLEGVKALRLLEAQKKQ